MLIPSDNTNLVLLIISPRNNFLLSIGSNVKLMLLYSSATETLNRNRDKIYRTYLCHPHRMYRLMPHGSNFTEVYHMKGLVGQRSLTTVSYTLSINSLIAKCQISKAYLRRVKSDFL